ncbi:MAG: ScpA family protein [Pseudomonadota bacterium]
MNSTPDRSPDPWASDAPVDRAISDPQLTVDVDGFEGPLDLLLGLARTQKVDLAKISILALADQYLEFVEEARRLRLELAADYLVMAAWLAYLKSRLLIPDPPGDDEPSGEDLANQLAFRLKKLEAMREAGRKLMERNQLGRDVFVRGMPEPVMIERKSDFSATLYDLLTAYASGRRRGSNTTVQIAARPVISLQEARDILVRLVGEIADWTPLDAFLIDYSAPPEMRASLKASAFAAMLEMVREGEFEMQQSANFEPIYLRRPRLADRSAMN